MVKWGNVSRYRRKLFFNFFFLFVAFAIVIGGFQYKREKMYRVGKLENTLQTYASLVNGYIIANGIDTSLQYPALKKFDEIFAQKGLRISVISNLGVVLFDSFVDDYNSMENHLLRPEIQESLHKKYGKAIRYSATTKFEYYYCAINFENYFVRTALPYNIQVENYLKADTYFVYVILLLFVVFGVVLIYLSDRFGKSITTLQNFARQAATGTTVDLKTKFPKNELGLIGQQIVEVYNRLQKTKKALSAEREKLIRHLQISHEGIAVFNKNKKQLLANNHFIQYLNTILDEQYIAPDSFFKNADFAPINRFIDKSICNNNNKINDSLSSKLNINKNGKYYVIQAIVFNDSSFEISINDVTKLEEEKKLKQQMTGNIAHELKTPVSSILGYLETIIATEMDKEKMKFFLERSYFQTQRLSLLIQDISVLNKIEEASDLFETEKISVKDTVSLVIDDLRMKIDENNIGVSIDLSDSLEIEANRSIFYSIWRNLIENSVNYAGENISIIIKIYHEDDNFLYFSYSDTGVGIPEKHFTRIFERFYRIDSGRARTNGGTGLGLSIVKNGVQFHKGEISVKKPKRGGIEFIFSICKKA